VRDPKSNVDCEEAHHPGAPGPIEQVSYPVSSGNRGRAWREPQSLTLLWSLTMEGSVTSDKLPWKDFLGC